MSVGTAEINQAPFGEQKDRVPIGKRVLIHLRLHIVAVRAPPQVSR
jgi:hypothetical protein